MSKKTKIILWLCLIAGFILSMVFIIPIISQKIELNWIRKEIKIYEQSKQVLSGEIEQLSMERKKCETLQATASEQADWKRGAIAQLDDKIQSLKLEYNQIVGFTQGW